MKHCITLIAFLCAFIFTSCNNDDNDSKQGLQDTVWVAVDTYTFDDMVCEDTYTIYFFDNTFRVDSSSKENGTVVETGSETGSYLYKHPNVVLTVLEGSVSVSISGTIAGDKMIFNSEDDTIVYTKQ